MQKTMFSELKSRADYNEIRDSTLGMYNLLPQDVHDKYVLDVGANKGIFTTLSIEYGAKKVFAVEPNIDNFNNLLKYTEQHPSIHCLNYAAYDSSQSFVTMFDDDEQSKVSKNVNVQNMVPTITLSQLLQIIPSNENNLILKVDCEGSEFPFLYSAKKEDICRFEIIYIELHGIPITGYSREALDDFRDYLISFGYNIEYSAWAFWQDIQPDGTLIKRENSELPIFKMRRNYDL